MQQGDRTNKWNPTSEPEYLKAVQVLNIIINNNNNTDLDKCTHFKFNQYNLKITGKMSSHSNREHNVGKAIKAICKQMMEIINLFSVTHKACKYPWAKREMAFGI